MKWKRFMIEYDISKREENLENIKEVVVEFEGRMSIKVRKQEKLDMVKERDSRKGELLENYMTKMLYR